MFLEISGVGSFVIGFLSLQLEIQLFLSSTVSSGTAFTFSDDRGSTTSISTVEGGEESRFDNIESFGVAGRSAVTGSSTLTSISSFSFC